MEKKVVQRNTAKYKTLLVIASIVMASLVIVAIADFVVTWFLQGPKNKEVSCANGEYLNYANICKPRFKVKNGIEMGSYASGVSISSGNKIIFSISYDTLGYLGVETTHNGEKTELELGDKYLYVDPKTGYFELTTYSEIEKAKNNGAACYSADEAWHKIGKDACVAFLPASFHYANNYAQEFINEKNDYTNGFVVAIMNGSQTISWDDLIDTYNTGQQITATGLIERYEGHPEIKVHSTRQLSIAKFYAYNPKTGFVWTSN